MTRIRAKKRLGQHFLSDNGIAERIVRSLSSDSSFEILEVGPGTGVLTSILLDQRGQWLRVIELDSEAIEYLVAKYPNLRLIRGDFLKYNFEDFGNTSFAIIGNFPYNISSQILFRVLELRGQVIEVVGMFQKEVAERICSGPGTKKYGILSVLLRIYYEPEFLFVVPPEKFIPPPKVDSAVIRLKRNLSDGPGCDEKLLFRVVKTTFNQRRKMIRNSLKQSFGIAGNSHTLLDKRPEQLHLSQFVELTNWVESIINH